MFIACLLLNFIKESNMLDTAQNTILNKTNSITNNTSKRPNSPSSEVDKLENKFEEMFAKAKQVKNPNAKATESAKQNAVQAKSTPQTTPTNKVAQAKVATSNSLMPFEFEDNNGQDSKISLQEKITKSSKESKAPEVNPLIEALSAPLATKNAPKDVKQNQNSESPLSQRNTKEQNIATNASLKTEQIQKSPTLTTMPTPQAPNNNNKTLGDIEKIAKEKGLNPSNMTLTQEENSPAPIAPKVREIPISAKEKIVYEYENNVDRIAIIQRGTKKPKNITSKISNEYPTKKPDDENINVSSSKDRPPIG